MLGQCSLLTAFHLESNGISDGVVAMIRTGSRDSTQLFLKQGIDYSPIGQRERQEAIRRQEEARYAEWLQMGLPLPPVAPLLMEFGQIGAFTDHQIHAQMAAAWAASGQAWAASGLGPPPFLYPGATSGHGPPPASIAQFAAYAQWESDDGEEYDGT